MIEGIFDLGETAVREVMIPLVDVVAVSEDATIGAAVARIHETGHARLAVYRERVDHLVGVVAALDILHRGAQAETVRGLMRPAHYVPETQRIDDLLREMQRRRIQLAVVVDEYGGCQGIVTVEDIVEEIVGEIQDEHDRPAPSSVTALPDGSYLVAGRIGIDELNETLDWRLPKHDYETVGGLVLSQLGRIPRPGEHVVSGGYEFSVVDADERRILKIKVRKATQTPAPGSPPAP
jgi:CBS domain containing-hemolysin-like protein